MGIVKNWLPPLYIMQDLYFAEKVRPHWSPVVCCLRLPCHWFCVSCIQKSLMTSGVNSCSKIGFFSSCLSTGRFKGNRTDEAITPRSLLQLLSSCDHDDTLSSGADNHLSNEDIAALLSHAPVESSDNARSFFKVIPEEVSSQ